MLATQEDHKWLKSLVNLFEWIDNRAQILLGKREAGAREHVEASRRGYTVGSTLVCGLWTMPKLAASFSPDELAARASGLYEQFRPDISAGSSGWVAADTLDLRKIDSLAHP